MKEHMALKYTIIIVFKLIMLTCSISNFNIALFLLEIFLKFTYLTSFFEHSNQGTRIQQDHKYKTYPQYFKFIHSQ